MSKDTDRVLGHADEADGIEEYDNPLPDWWVGMFWFTIVWAIGYGLWYHVFTDRSQEGLLAQEMAAAEVRYASQPGSEDGGVAAFAVNAETVAAGQSIYAMNCVACHGANLEGGIGPSFLDDEWVHGGRASDVIRIVTEGVAAKGMIPWRGILSPEQINHVSAYVISMSSEATGRSIEDFLAESGGAEDTGEGEDEEPAGEDEAAVAPPPGE